MASRGISCVSIAKDLVSQGYPFVESIASIVKLCDEFVIQADPSSDGTKEALEELRTPGEDQGLLRTVDLLWGRAC